MGAWACLGGVLSAHARARMQQRGIPAAVVEALPDHGSSVDPKGWEGTRADAALFCGMTRATVRLEILAKEGNETSARLFKAADS